MTNQYINNKLAVAGTLAGNGDYRDAYYELMNVLDRILLDDPYGEIRLLKLDRDEWKEAFMRVTDE